MKMPVLFIGHGSPMNAIENNVFSREWMELGNLISRPRAILAISAHWYTNGTCIQDIQNPRMIYDMYGFPKELYEVTYPVSGYKDLSQRVEALLSKDVQVNNTWGIDHGTWSILVHMYPNADIPVVQLSVNSTLSPERHYQLGQELATLREEGYLILASGNVVHNLGRIDWYNEGGTKEAISFDHFIRDNIMEYQYSNILEYKKHKDADYAVPYPDHFSPLLYALGCVSEKDQVSVLNDACVLGSLSMTSYLFQDRV